VRSSSKGVGLPPGAQVSLLVVQIGPALDAAVLHVFASGPDTCGFTHFEQLKEKIGPKFSKTLRKRIFPRLFTFVVNVRRINRALIGLDKKSRFVRLFGFKISLFTLKSTIDKRNSRLLKYFKDF
jgi:hypothetical protein